MTQEAYVSFEVAKLLKRKGFNGPCKSYFGDYVVDIDYFYSKEELTDLDMGIWETLRPTQQMACAWLREKHLIHIYAEYKAFFQEKPKKVYYHWMPFVKTLPNCSIYNSGFPNSLDIFCDNYEEAIEAALKYTLENLI